MHAINRLLTTVCTDEWSTKVAFASTDYHHVNQHFGNTPRLVIYGVKEKDISLLRVVEFSVTPEHQNDHLTHRIAVLGDCMTVYCVAIGESVFQQLLQAGVRAVRVADNTPIPVLLQEIQSCWCMRPD